MLISSEVVFFGGNASRKYKVLTILLVTFLGWLRGDPFSMVNWTFLHGLNHLGGGCNIFLSFHPYIPGEMTQFDEHIF